MTTRGFVRHARCPLRIDFAGATTDLEPFASAEGGCVLNAAITRYAEGQARYGPDGVAITYGCEAPPRSGLGASGALNLCWLALVTGDGDRLGLAETVYRIEQARGERGGRQDQYASAVGGVNVFHFGRVTRVEALTPSLAPDLLRTLADHLLLVYAMPKPDSFSKNVQDEGFAEAVARGDSAFLANLKSIKDVALEMRGALLAGRLADLGRLMNDEWGLRKRLHPVKTDPALDAFISHGLRHAIGAKPCGSAGGGFVLFYTEDRARLRAALGDRHLVWDVAFDFTGLDVRVTDG